MQDLEAEFDDEERRLVRGKGWMSWPKKYDARMVFLGRVTPLLVAKETRTVHNPGVHNAVVMPVRFSSRPGPECQQPGPSITMNWAALLYLESKVA